MTKIDTKEIRKKYGEVPVQKDEYGLITISYPDVIELCDAYDKAQKEIKNLQSDLFAHTTKSQNRISTLEALLGEARNTMLSMSEKASGGCVFCGEGIINANKGNHLSECFLARIQKELSK